MKLSQLHLRKLKQTIAGGRGAGGTFGERCLMEDILAILSQIKFVKFSVEGKRDHDRLIKVELEELLKASSSTLRIQSSL